MDLIFSFILRFYFLFHLMSTRVTYTPDSRCIQHILDSYLFMLCMTWRHLFEVFVNISIACFWKILKKTFLDIYTVYTECYVQICICVELRKIDGLNHLVCHFHCDRTSYLKLESPFVSYGL
ncbi:unnamed protein product [Camellia sinensis]